MKLHKFVFTTIILVVVNWSHTTGQYYHVVVNRSKKKKRWGQLLTDRLAKLDKTIKAGDSCKLESRKAGVRFLPG